MNKVEVQHVKIHREKFRTLKDPKNSKNILIFGGVYKNMFSPKILTLDTKVNKVSDSYLPELPTSFGDKFFTICSHN